MTRVFWRITVLWLALAAYLPAAVSAQIMQAELRGIVHDESGAALPGATVVATHVETGATRTTATSETGAFIMPSLPVGAYKVTIELTGFQALTQEGLRLAVGQSASITFTMKVATLAESVTVAAEAPLVETKRSELSGRVEPKQVENLPLNGRNWLDLVGLVPGARGTPGTGSNIQAGAAGNDMTKYQMDGQDVGGQCCGGTNQSYSQEIIAEFQVLTNRFDAEYGRAGGAVISAVTKTGTNQLRATGFGFLRDDKFDAPNFVANRVLPFHESQVGFTVGGPILRDRAHFFGSYERQARDASTSPNTRIAQFDSEVSQDAKRHLWTGRGDVQLGTQHRAFARASYYDLDQINQGVGGRATVSNGYSYPIKNTDLSVGETWVISDRLVHEIRTGFSYIDNALISNSPTVQYSFPSAVIGSPTNSPQWWKEMNIQFNNSISYFVPSWKGEHNLRAGFQFFRPKFWGELPQESYGAFNFARDPSDFNDPSTYPAPTSFSISLGDFSYSAANPTYAAFVQDNWTITPKLSLNLGVRYDVESGVKNTDFLNPVETGERASDADNFAPRVGFAYDVRRHRPHRGARRIRALLRQGAAEHHHQRAAAGDGAVHRRDRPEPEPDRSAGRPDVRRLQEPEPSAQHHRAGERLRDAAVRSGVDRPGAADRHALRVSGRLRAHQGRERAAPARSEPVRGSGHAPAAQPGAVRASVPAVRAHHALRDVGEVEV